MRRLTLMLLLIGLGLPSAPAQTDSEDNTPSTDLNFDLQGGRRIEWIVPDMSGKLFTNPDVNTPPYVAELWLHKAHIATDSAHIVLEFIKKSPVLHELSKRQQQFLDSGHAIWPDYESKQLPDTSKPIPDFFPTWLYAFSETDARTMVRAYLDGLNREVAQRMSEYQRALTDLKHTVQQATQQLAKKQTERDAADKQLQQQKQIRYEFDTDPDQSAKETLKEMRDTLDKLDIELIGIREKLKSIEAFRKETGKQSLSPQVQIKLDEMYIELMIELSGLEARRALAQKIQDQATGFLDLFVRTETLRADVRKLHKTIDGGQGSIERITWRLENPTGNSRPPKVHKNTVRIHRVKGSTAPADVQAYIEEIQKWLSEKEASQRSRFVDPDPRTTKRFLEMVDSGYLQVAPQVVETLMSIQQQLLTQRVEEFLQRTQDEFKDSFFRAIQQPQFAQRYRYRVAYAAREYLEQVEQGQLQLDPLLIKKLQHVVSNYPRERLEHGLQLVDKSENTSHIRRILENLRVYQQQIEKDGLKLDPSLVERLDAALKKYEPPQEDQ